MQIRIIHTIGFQSAPEGRNTQHYRATTIYRIILQEVNQALHADIPDIVRTVGETDTPDSHYRLSVMVQISFRTGLISHLLIVHQPLPVFYYHGAVFTGSSQTGQIIHHSDGTIILGSCFQGIFQDTVRHRILLISTGIVHKTLYKHAIHSVIFHPLEMQINSRLVRRAEYTCFSSVGMTERSLIRFLILAHIGPCINGTMFLVKLLSGSIMAITLICTILRSTKPTLISRHYQSFITRIRSLRGVSGTGISEQTHTKHTQCYE